MRRAFLLAIAALILAGSAPAQTIESTIADIVSLKSQLARKREEVSRIRAELMKNNPVFSPKDPFEIDSEYFVRCVKGAAMVDSLQKSLLAPLWLQMGQLRSRVFESENFTVVADPTRYDANVGTWTIVITHGAYQKESREVVIPIEPAKARLLHQNLSGVKVIGSLGIDPGERVAVTRLVISEASSGLHHEVDYHFIGSAEMHSKAGDVEFSPDGQTFAAGSSYIYLLNATNALVLQRLDSPGSSLTLSYCFNGEYLAVGGWTVAKILPLRSGGQVRTIGIGPSDVRTVQFAPDGRFMLVAARQRRDLNGDLEGEAARIYDVATDRLLDMEYGSEVRRAALGKGGTLLALGGFKTVGVQRLSGEAKPFGIYFDRRVGPLTFNEDGALLAIGTDEFTDNEIRVVEPETGQEIHRFPQGSAITGLAFSPDSRYLAVTSEKQLLIYGTEEDRLVKSIDFPDYVSCVAYSPDGAYLAVGGSGGGGFAGRTYLVRPLVRDAKLSEDESGAREPATPNASRVTVRAPRQCWVALISAKDAVGGKYGWWSVWYERKSRGDYAITPCTVSDLTPGEYTLVVYDPAAEGGSAKSDGVVLEKIIVAADSVLVYDLKDTDFRSWNCLSCPWIYVFDGRGFVKLSEILRDVTGFAGRSSDVVPLPGDICKQSILRVRIVEEKDEVTYLDAVELLVDGRTYPPVACSPGEPAQFLPDEQHMTLSKGDWVEFTFVRPIAWHSGSVVSIRARGYYEPEPGALEVFERAMLQP